MKPIKDVSTIYEVILRGDEKLRRAEAILDQLVNDRI